MTDRNGFEPPPESAMAENDDPNDNHSTGNHSADNHSADNHSTDNQANAQPSPVHPTDRVITSQSATETSTSENAVGDDARTETVLRNSSPELSAATTGNHRMPSERTAPSTGATEWTIDRLIEEYAQYLFGYAYRLVGSVSDAEDLAQQTFLIAHQKLEQLRSSAAAKSWLCAILRSCWLRSIRRNQPNPVSNLEIDLNDFLIDSNREMEFDSQAIQLALQELPADYRLVLLMYYFEELSYQEIAENLNVKIGTVMSRLSRAKNRMRARLKNKDCLLDK